MCCFYPDFIFWLKSKQSKEYKIIFIDPKGLTHEVNARDKAQGFESIFGENGNKGLENQVFFVLFQSARHCKSKSRIAKLCQIYY